MKWIKTRKTFLNEAKLRDVILPTQAKQVVANWGEKWLDLEEIEPTHKIKQGRWKLSHDDKIEVLATFFDCDLVGLMAKFAKLSDKFRDVIEESIDANLVTNENLRMFLNNFDIQKPSINQLSILADPIFRKIAVSETLADEVIVKDANGRPIMGEDGRPQKRKRDEGEIIFSRNLVNINTFVADFNRVFEDSKVDPNVFLDPEIGKIIGKSKEDLTEGRGYRAEIDLYGRDMFLSVKHNPKDILNMSISTFYGSCQNLYSGGYKHQVIGNVFDPNTIPAYIIFDTPILNREGEVISEQLPMTRLMIRNIEKFDQKEEAILFFDRAYPDRMYDVLCKIIEKYSDNKRTLDARRFTDARPGAAGTHTYLFTPDLPEDFDVNTPYMDKLGIETGKYIGVNTDKITLVSNYNWSKTFISPKAKIKELTIETPDIPANLLQIPIKPDWVKFRFIKINDLSQFKQIKTDSIALEKCKFKGEELGVLKDWGIKKLQLISCEVEHLDFTGLEDLEELHLVYTLDSSDEVTLNGVNYDSPIQAILQGMKLKKLVVSGDLVAAYKKEIGALKQKGVKVETVGPVI